MFCIFKGAENVTILFKIMLDKASAHIMAFPENQVLYEHVVFSSQHILWHSRMHGGWKGDDSTLRIGNLRK